MGNIDTRIDALQQRLKQLKVKQHRIEARKRSVESRKVRREDLRRKILVGAIVLAKVERGEIPRATLDEWLDGALTRDDDRALFELPRNPADAAVPTTKK
jgi:hypothetical protein